MPSSEEAMRWAGALVVLAAVSALVLVLFPFPAPAALEPRYAVLVLGLFVAFLIGSAAVLLSPAHRAAAHLARRAAEAARALQWVWVGFTGIALYSAYVLGDADAWKATAAAVSADKVNGFVFFLVFLAGVWTVNMSVLTVTGSGSPPLPPADEEIDGGEMDAMIP